MSPTSDSNTKAYVEETLLAEQEYVIAEAADELNEVFQLYYDLQQRVPGDSPAPSSTDWSAEIAPKCRKALVEITQALRSLSVNRSALSLTTKELNSSWVQFCSWFYTKKRDELASKIESFTNSIATTEKRIRNRDSFLREQKPIVGARCTQLVGRAASALNDIHARIADVIAAPPHTAPWDATEWSQWQPQSLAELPSSLRYGEYAHHAAKDHHELDQWPARELQGAAKSSQLSAEMPLIGHDRCVVLQYGSATKDAADLLMQALLMRLLVIMPYDVRFTLLDPHGLGRSFQVRSTLGDAVRPRSKSVDGVLHCLRDVGAEVEALHEDVLQGRAMHELPEDVLASQKFEFLFAAGFPKGYDNRSIELLFHLASSGPAAGKYVLLQHDADTELPRGYDLKQIRNRHTIQVRQDGRINFDAPPSESIRRAIAERISANRPPMHQLDWWSTVGLPKDQWWQETSKERVHIRLGGEDGELSMWLGVDNGVACSHGMLAGTTGSGKSSLYHSLILGLAIRYPPSELQFYLVDGKDGVEFQAYKALPHATVVSLRSTPEMSRNILKEVVREKERRNELFEEHDCRDLTEYVERGCPGGVCPRMIVLVDEYQEFFQGDRDGVASELLQVIASQGRSAGIHLLLGSQRFGAPNMLGQRSVFNNIHLRMAMRMSQDAIDGISEFGAAGKQRIRQCDEAGKIVINHRTGEDGGNTSGKVAYLQPEQYSQLVEEICLGLDKQGFAQRPRVFHGAEQPLLRDNQLLRRLAAEPPLPAASLEQLGQTSAAAGGFGMANWSAGDKPIGMWIGAPLSIYGETMLSLRRTSGENVAVLGSDTSIRYGIVAAMLASLPVLYEPHDVGRIIIVDGAIPKSPGGEAIEQVKSELLDEMGFHVDHCGPHDDSGFAILEDVLANRTQAQMYHEPAVLFVLVDPDRVAGLHGAMQAQDAASSQRSVLQMGLHRGPSLGVHIIVTANNLSLLRTAIDEHRDSPSIQHRIALQMSEDDSFRFCRDRAASRLQVNGTKPVQGLYFNVERGSRAVFKPYTSATLADDLAELKAWLKQRQPVRS